ncbi:MAG: HEAT repeat domain-containing protein [Candidatus Hodarchaeota archaeon]
MGKPYPDPDYNPYKIRRENIEKPTPVKSTRSVIDFINQRICPSCGKLIKFNHNFCKFCGVDLSSIEPIGSGDEVSKQLAATAISDPDADVRKDAVDTLGEFGEIKILGVLTYVLLNDSDEHVRKKAAEELGDMAHPISLDVLAKALKDRSPIVRKEAIEGLKKIKKKNKPIPQPEIVEQKLESEEIEHIEDDKVEVIEEQEEEEEKEQQPLQDIEKEDYYKL